CSPFRAPSGAKRQARRLRAAIRSASLLSWKKTDARGSEGFAPRWRAPPAGWAATARSNETGHGAWTPPARWRSPPGDAGHEARGWRRSVPRRSSAEDRAQAGWVPGGQEATRRDPARRERNPGSVRGDQPS